MNSSLWSLLLVLLLALPASGQDYGEFARGAAIARRRPNRGPLFALIASGLLGGAAGGWLTARRLNRKHQSEKQELLSYIAYQDNVHSMAQNKLLKEYDVLYRANQELENEISNRDYEEFKAPDTDNDNMISRSEFNTYVQKYLQSFPELSDKDFPRFDEFDHDRDDRVSFDEWERFLYQQKLDEKNKSESKAADKRLGDGPNKNAPAKLKH